jgi:hypothetical protein
LSKGTNALKAAFSAAALAFLVTGCGGPLKVAYNPVSPAAKAPAAGVRVEIAPFVDARGEGAKAKGSRTIGRITATVADMNSGELTLDKDVEEIVTGAFVKEFASAGYEVRERDGDFAVTGTVRKFRLDVGPRDEIEISVAVKIMEKETGRTLWEDTVVEKNSRYAGVFGNSRATLERYITATLSKVIKKTLDETAPAIANTGAAYRPASVKGPAEEKSVEESPAGTGRLLVTTVPTRSRIYINGVYWGLSPLSSDIEPGVYELVVRQKGFKENKEKVSVRTGQMTELEMSLEKE